MVKMWDRFGYKLCYRTEIYETHPQNSPHILNEPPFQSIMFGYPFVKFPEFSIRLLDDSSNTQQQLQVGDSEAHPRVLLMASQPTPPTYPPSPEIAGLMIRASFNHWFSLNKAGYEKVGYIR